MKTKEAYLDLERCLPNEDFTGLNCNFVWRYIEHYDAEDLIEECSNQLNGGETNDGK